MGVVYNPDGSISTSAAAPRTTITNREYFAWYAPLRSAQHALDIIAREVPGTRVATLAAEESDRIEQAIATLRSPSIEADIERLGGGR